MIDFMQSIWTLNFQTIQYIFDFDLFLGTYIGLLIVVLSTVHLLAYIIFSICKR